MKDRIVSSMLQEENTGREPNIYAFFFLTAIFAVGFGILLYNDTRADILAFLLVFYLSLLLLLLGWAEFCQARYNPYSYNIIYYRGFILFFLLFLGTSIQYCRGIFSVPDAFTSRDIIWFITDSVISYLNITAPAIVVFSVWLCISNICLIRHGGKRLVNVLGIILAFLLTGGILLLIQFGIVHISWVPAKYKFAVSLLVNLCSVIYLYFECMLIGAFAAVFTVARYEPVMDKDFIIILGCRIRKDGTPTPLLRERVNRALAFYRMQKEQTGKMPVFVTSGGKGTDEVTSESASMKAYLLSQGIPEEQIIEENQSVNTYQNMLYSKEKILAVNPDAKIAFSTTSYHVFRSGLYARRVGIRAFGMGARTKWWFWPNATVREFVGLLTDSKKLQALILGSFLVICTAMTILSFR